MIVRVTGATRDHFIELGGQRTLCRRAMKWSPFRALPMCKHCLKVAQLEHEALFDAHQQVTVASAESRLERAVRATLLEH